jgi:hypothetical protein
MQEWLWRGGPRRWAIAMGFVCGLSTTGVLLLVVPGPAVGAVVGGLVSWVLCGALMTAVGWPGWRRGEHLSLLSPSDRVAVIRAVQKGEPVPGPRLAPSVLAFAKVAISAAEQEQRRRWVFYLLPALMIAVAVGLTVAGSVRPAAYFWALTVFSLVSACLLPGRAERRLKNAGEAARIAGEQITGQGGTSC